jgi:aromatase
MSQQETRHDLHETTVAASADEVYALVADVSRWPQIFPPTVHAERLRQDGDDEVIRIWATAGDEAKTWTSRRRLRPDQRSIEFRQQVSQPPVQAMGGKWRIEPVGDRACQVRLYHDYRAVDDDPEGLAWIARAVDRNSTAELAALKETAERNGSAAETRLTFQDSVCIAGPVAEIYDFLNEAQHWARRLPHVARVELREETPGLQLLDMDTRTTDGSVHTTRSVRVCFRPHQIIYKQIATPALMDLHTGRWLLVEKPDGVEVISEHTVAINPERVTAVLGAEADLAGARKFVREALGANSRATLEHARRHAER